MRDYQRVMRQIARTQKSKASRPKSEQVLVKVNLA